MPRCRPRPPAEMCGIAGCHCPAGRRSEFPRPNATCGRHHRSYQSCRRPCRRAWWRTACSLDSMLRVCGESAQSDDELTSPFVVLRRWNQVELLRIIARREDGQPNLFCRLVPRFLVPINPSTPSHERRWQQRRQTQNRRHYEEVAEQRQPCLGELLLHLRDASLGLLSCLARQRERSSYACYQRIEPAGSPSRQRRDSKRHSDNAHCGYQCRCRAARVIADRIRRGKRDGGN